MAVAPNGDVIVMDNPGGPTSNAWRSSDGGQTFAIVGSVNSTVFEPIGSLAIGSLVGFAIGDAVATSANGAVWSTTDLSTLPFTGGNSTIMTDGGNNWVILSNQLNGGVAYSNDGTGTWHLSNGIGSTGNPGIWDGTQFVGFAQILPNNVIYTSPDGQHYATTETGAFGLNFLVFTRSGQYVYTDGRGNDVLVANSPIALATATPTPIPFLDPGGTYAIAASPNRVVVGDFSGGVAFSDQNDLVTWTPGTLNLQPTEFAAQLAYNPVHGNFIVLGGFGTICTCPTI